MRGHVPYIRLLKDIPREMKKKLPGAYRAVFELRVWLALFMPEWTKVADTIKNVPKAEKSAQISQAVDPVVPCRVWGAFPALECAFDSLSIY